MTVFVRQLCKVGQYNLHLVICNSGVAVVRESFLEEVTPKLNLKGKVRISQAKEKGKLSRLGKLYGQRSGKNKNIFMEARESKHFERWRAEWDLGRGEDMEIQNEAGDLYTESQSTKSQKSFKE